MGYLGGGTILKMDPAYFMRTRVQVQLSKLVQNYHHFLASTGVFDFGYGLDETKASATDIVLLPFYNV